MKEKENPALVSIDYQKLSQFFVRMVAGIGILNIWGSLAIVSITALIYGVNWLSGFEGFSYGLGVLFIPLGIFCWWVCTMLSLEFLSEIGIELNGIARFIVVPIALPMAGISFLFGLWASAGESIKTRTILYFSFATGIVISAAITVLIV